MKFAVAWCVLFALPPCSAIASAYSDFNAGITARNGKYCKLAINYLSAAIASPQLLPNLRPVALTARGSCYFSESDTDSALADYTASLKLRPDNYETLEFRGSVYLKTKRYEEAISDFSALVRIRPDLFEGYDAVGSLYEGRKNYDAAISEYGAFVEKYPDFSDGYFSLVDAYLLKRDATEALEYADKLASLAPKYAPVYQSRAAVHEMQGDFEGALDDIDTALDLDPSNKGMVQFKGMVQWILEKYSRSADSLASAAEQDPSNAYSTLWLDLARVRASQRDSDLAARAAKLDLNLWPGPLVALFLGRTTPESVMNSISMTDDRHDAEECEADFYVAEWKLQHQDKEGAIPLLKHASEACPSLFIERYAADAELKRLP